MLIQVDLSEQIINECLQLHYTHQPAGKKLRLRLLLIPAVLLVLGAFLIVDEMRQPAPGTNFFMALLYISFAVGYYFFMRKRLIHSGRRLLKNLGTNANFTVQVTDTNLITNTAHYSNTVDWHDFTGALVGRQNVLLYQSNNSFTMFNQSFFMPNDFEAFKAMVRQQVSPCIEA